MRKIVGRNIYYGSRIDGKKNEPWPPLPKGRLKLNTIYTSKGVYGKSETSLFPI